MRHYPSSFRPCYLSDQLPTKLRRADCRQCNITSQSGAEIRTQPCAGDHHHSESPKLNSVSKNRRMVKNAGIIPISNKPNLCTTLKPSSYSPIQHHAFPCGQRHRLIMQILCLETFSRMTCLTGRSVANAIFRGDKMAGHDSKYTT
jgi:hypothetical protein